ncbi:hypothetical protein [Flavobacterium sp. JP2137]|uniref:hypothetical protein n=1 Tax=Flavobacterium sp. JP2137 TaxID=3414510 RepID=UPI003D3014D4
MKKLKGIAVILVLMGFVSCKKDADQPKVIYEEKKVSVREPQKIDSTQIKIADLPILMEGTKYLIHPIGDVRVYDVSSKYGSTKVNQVSYAISNYNRYELTGYFQNLMFQHMDSTHLRPLTDQVIQIQTVTFLSTIAEKTKKKVLVYTIVDQDTNRDGKIDSNDIKSLYISLNNGTKFTKLSEDLHELLDWSVIDSQSRLYFRTIEDINKNGAFDNKDAVNYFFVDLNTDAWKIESYNPMGH